MSRYLGLLILAGIIPFFLSFYPALKFYSRWRALACSIGLVVIIFGSWDVFAVARRHWSFDHAATGKLRVINLPLEEVLFFIVIPFCCIFTWEALNYLKNKRK